MNTHNNLLGAGGELVEGVPRDDVATGEPHRGVALG